MSSKYPGYRTMTGVARRNARMHKMFDDARALTQAQPVYPVGTGVHYTGDVANQPGNGTVTAIRPANEWAAESMDITLEDGRQMRAIQMSNFSGIGRRFWSMEEYQADRAKKIEQMRVEFDAIMARKAVTCDCGCGSSQQHQDY
jgi:hypothetical protein